MKNRRHIFIFLCLTGIISAVGCDMHEKDYTDDVPAPILFAMPQMTVQTKSGPINAIPAGSSFGVIGYCLPDKIGGDDSNPQYDYEGGTTSWPNKRNRCRPSVFYGQKVTVTGQGCVYDKDYPDGNSETYQPKYWYRAGYGLDGETNGSIPESAEDYQYSFFAYYPFDDEIFNIISPKDEQTRGAPRLAFTMPFKNKS